MGMNALWILDMTAKGYFALKNGTQIMDGRAPNPNVPGKDYARIQEYDSVHIRLVDKDNKPVKGEPLLHFTAKKNASQFSSIEDALTKIDAQKLLPGAVSADDVIKHYSSFTKYAQRIKDNGFVVVEMTPVALELCA